MLENKQLLKETHLLEAFTLKFAMKTHKNTLMRTLKIGKEMSTKARNQADLRSGSAGGSLRKIILTMLNPILRLKFISMMIKKMRGQKNSDTYSLE